MSRRRRVELYFAVAFLAASLSYADRHGVESTADSTRIGGDDPYIRVVFFLDEPAGVIGPDAFRRVVNVVTASAFGIAGGFVLSLLLLDGGDRWRFLPRRTGGRGAPLGDLDPPDRPQ